MRGEIQHIAVVLLVALMVFSPRIEAKNKPKDAAALTTEQRQQFNYYWYAARQAIEEERYAEAYSLLQFCNALNPNDAQTLTYLGVLYQGLGDQDRSKEAFKRAYELAPDKCWQRYLEPLKMELLQQRKWKEAIKIQDEIERRKGEYDAYCAIDRYRIYALWGKNKKAIEAIDRYLETDPMNLRFLLFRVELMEQMGTKAKELYALYDRVLALDPYNVTILNNYAWHLATHKGDLVKAERMSQMTIREEPNNPSYLDTYGWILHLQGQDELAKFYLEKAARYSDDANRSIIMEHLIKVTK